MDKIKKIVETYVKKYNTNNPYELADILNIKVFYFSLGNIAGQYKYLKHTRCIFLNSDIEDENLLRVVMAHELGHAILHMKENCCFMKNNTLLLTSKLELQANKFAAELLISNEDIEEYKEFSKEQFSKILGYSEKLIDLKFM